MKTLLITYAMIFILLTLLDPSRSWLPGFGLITLFGAVIWMICKKKT